MQSWAITNKPKAGPYHNLEQVRLLSCTKVPELCRLVIGRLFGFTPNTAGSLSQNTEDLKQFFINGVWRDWRLEEQSFEEFF